MCKLVNTFIYGAIKQSHKAPRSSAEKLRNCLKERSGFRSSGGRLFHSRCPAAAKARSTRRVMVRCSTHVSTLEDCSCRRLVALTSWQSSDRYGGTRLFKTLNIKNASLIELDALPNRQPVKFS